jgi:hypothetical protein
MITLRTGLTVSTVNTYLKRIFAKLGVHSRVELVARMAGTDGILNGGGDDAAFDGSMSEEEPEGRPSSIRRGWTSGGCRFHAAGSPSTGRRTRQRRVERGARIGCALRGDRCELPRRFAPAGRPVPCPSAWPTTTRG